MSVIVAIISNILFGLFIFYNGKMLYLFVYNISLEVIFPNNKNRNSNELFPVRGIDNNNIAFGMNWYGVAAVCDVWISVNSIVDHL